MLIYSLEDDDYDRRPQRRRYDAPLPVRIRKQLLGLAESPLRRWHEEVQSIAHVVADNYEDQELRTSFLELVPQLLIEQPLKTPFVAAVVLVINSLKPDILSDLLARVTVATEEKIKVGEWRDVKLYLKFLACLQSCLEGDGLFPLLEELFNRAGDLQTASSDDVSIHTSLVVCCRYIDTITDNWYRTRQDYPSYHSVYHGNVTYSVATKGGRANGQDGCHRFRTPRATSANRPVSSRRRK